MSKSDFTIKKPIRTLSGVVPVALMTKPYFCPGKCIYCPNEPGMPKSYLPAEPGSQRAIANRFDPYSQITSRLQMYHINGHPTDKIELIILGGTWSAYPLSYRTWFIKRCFEALNGRVSASLQAAQKINETAKHRCVGLSVETRPDLISKQELISLRRLGCTKIQIGIQSLDNRVLRLNRRGHTIRETKKAVKLLRSFGFKIQAHWMANLYGSTLAKDAVDFKKLFAQKWYRPDELKIYPCSLIETAELMKYYRAKLWRPYSQEELTNLMIKLLPFVPGYCRVSRMIRDFSSADIVAGNKMTNLRQLVEERAKNIAEIRYREIKNEPAESLRLKVIGYTTSVGREKFIQWVTAENKIAGFLRLALPRSKVGAIKELAGAALIRELHIYGRALRLGELAQTQHAGLGKKLLVQAKNLARGYKKLSVISAVGTRQYYRKLGFKDGQLYQHLKLVD